MKGLLRLTDWDSGESVYVRANAIALIVRLPATVHESYTGGAPTEIGGRTRINVGENDLVLVRETPDEIYAAMERLEKAS